MAGGYANVVLATSGLVSYYRLGDTTTTATDSKGSNNGTYAGTYTQSQKGALYGDTNNAVLLTSGLTGTVDCGNPAAFQISTGSLEIWVNGSTTPLNGTFQVIVEKNSAWGMFWAGNSAQGQNIGFYDWGGATYHDCGVTINDGKWHHLVLTFQPSTASMYLDGVNKISGAAMTVSSQTLNLFVGANAQGGAAQNLNATFDELAVYNVALSAATILNHYQEGQTMRSNQIAHRASRPVTPSQGRF